MNYDEWKLEAEPAYEAELSNEELFLIEMSKFWDNVRYDLIEKIKAL